MGGQVKNEGEKRSSKTLDIVSYALKVSVNGVTCAFVVHLRPSDSYVRTRRGCMEYTNEERRTNQTHLKVCKLA